MPKRNAGLQDEVEARMEAMEATGDIPPEDRERQALEDIADMTSAEHGCLSPSECQVWNRLRRAARKELMARFPLD